nr:calcium-binding protein [Niveibacterium umoris]
MVADDGFGNAETIRNVEAVQGTQFADQITLGNLGTYAFGRAGDDTIIGGDGTNLLVGGSGADSLVGGAGVDRASYDDDGYDAQGGITQGIQADLAAGLVTDGWGNVDTLSGIEAITGSSLDDQIAGDAANNILDGGDGADTLTGNAGNDTLNGGNGSDVLDGGDGNDSLTGGDGDFNQLSGGNGNDTLIGGSGDDDLTGGAGNDYIDGGSGSNWVDYSGFSKGIVLNLSLTTAQYLGDAGTDTILRVDHARGTSGNDRIIGNAHANWFSGAGGNDTLEGGDTIKGNDGVGYAEAVAAVRIDLATGTATSGSETDKLIDIDGANGSAFDDQILGNANNNWLSGGVRQIQRPNGYVQILLEHTGNDTIDGRGGDDQIAGFDGDDSLIGGTGNDTLWGGAGNDTLVGDAGNDLMVGDEDWTVDTDPAHGWNYAWNSGFDLADYSRTTGGVTVRLGSGSASGAEIGNDTLWSIEAVLGGSGNDLLTAGVGSASLAGGGGNDSVYGDAGNDTLSGGDGNDWLNGGSGSNLIDGGAGDDVVFYLYGNQGADINLDTGVVSNDGFGTSDTLTGIENAHGTQFGDTVTLGSTGGYVFGRGGNDTLIGSAGDNGFFGGSGADLITGNGGNDRASYDDDGYDAAGLIRQGIIANLSTGLVIDGWGDIDTLAGIENLTASALADSIAGDGAANDLVGGRGADTIDGQGGADTLEGGDGDDLYLVGADPVTLIETAAGGIDRVESSGIRFTLQDNIEQLRYTGNGLAHAAAGSTLAGWEGFDAGAPSVLAEFVGIGNGLANLLTGGDGNDVLDGGAGNDTLAGGLGDDYYFIDSLADVVQEASGAAGGNDTIFTRLGSYSLAGAPDVENLQLAYGASTAFRGTGNDRDNYVSGRYGNDTLDGGAGNDTLFGGAGGADSLRGGLGDDTLAPGAYRASDLLAHNQDVLDGGQGSDTAILYGQQSDYTITGFVGADLVLSYKGQASVKLGGIEFVRFDADGDPADDTSPTGDALALASLFQTRQTGTAGNDLLASGADGDTLAGLGGNDTYIVRHGGVKVNELLGAGLDEIRTTLSEYSLPANVEKLSFIGDAAQTVVLDLAALPKSNDAIWTGPRAVSFFATGNGLANSISGSAGNDVLVGGAGLDTLAGGSGNDWYYVDSAADSIVEQAREGTDRICVNESMTSYSLAPLTLANIEELSYAGSRNFTGTGNALANLIASDAGNDSLSGGLGNDTLIGGRGNDRLDGGVGNDTLIDDDGNDTLIGGSGSDWLQVGLRSTILDSSGNPLPTNRYDLVTVDGGTDPATPGGPDASTDTLYLHGRVSDYAFSRPDANSIRIIDRSGKGEIIATGIERLYFDGDGVFDNFNQADTATGALNDDLWIKPADLAGIAINIGTAAADTLSSAALNDVLVGAGGNDTYLVAHEGVRVIESASGGIDTVQLEGGLSEYTLASGVERLIYHGPAVLASTRMITVLGQTVAINAESLLVGNDDTLPGTGNYLEGGIGSDLLDGHAGADTMRGGADSDSYIVDNSADVVLEDIKGGDHDRVYSVLASTTLAANVEDLVLLTGWRGAQASGNALDNSVMGAPGDDTLYGLAGKDTLLGMVGSDYLSGGDGNDYLDGGSDADTLVGGAGNDALWSGGGNDSISGGTGSDFIRTDAGVIRVDGGNDSTVYGAADTAVDLLWVLGTQADYQFTRLNPTTTRMVSTSTGEDITFGNIEAVSFAGRQVVFSDTLLRSIGYAGNDTLVGLSLADTMDGAAGNDSIRGGEGDDLIFGRVGNDTLLGESGTDSLLGNDGADSLLGGDGNDSLDGGDGNNTLIGGAGDDQLVSGSGNDVYRWAIGDGFDRITDAGGATDRLEVSAPGSAISFSHFNGNGLMVLVDGKDAIAINGQDAAGRIESILFNGALQTVAYTEPAVWFGTEYTDSLVGSAENDRMLGFNGSDTIRGGDGNDWLDGGSGWDELFGGAGNDTLVASGGGFTDSDRIQPGDGEDLIFITGGGDQSDVGVVLSPDGTNDVISLDNATHGVQWAYLDLGQFLQNSSLWFNRSSDDLIVTNLEDKGDTLTVRNWFAGADHQLDRFELFYYSLRSGDVQALVDAMAGYAIPAGSSIPTDGSYADVLNSVNTLWH